MAPLFLILTLGVVEVGFGLNASNTLHGAVREGGRLASQDFKKTVAPGQTANEKVIQDIKNMLTAAGIDGDDVTVTIEHADNPGTDFNLEDGNNYLKYFRIEVSVPSEDVLDSLAGRYLGGKNMRAGMTFRMGRIFFPQ